MTRPEDKPYVENYPPLKAWLDEHEARCQWQKQLPMVGGPSMIECWVIGSATFMVLVHSNGHGWDLFTSHGGNSIPLALADAEKRLGIKPVSITVKFIKTPHYANAVVGVELVGGDDWLKGEDPELDAWLSEQSRLFRTAPGESMRTVVFTRAGH